MRSPVTTAGPELNVSDSAQLVQEESAYELELDAWGYALLPIVLVLVFRSVNAPLSHYQPQCT